MIGGKVIGIARGSETTLLHIVDPEYTDGSCAVRVREQRSDNGRRIFIMLGDEIRLENRYARWTPDWSLRLNKQDTTSFGDARLRDVKLPMVTE